jgi:hypothetical protein
LDVRDFRGVPSPHRTSYCSQTIETELQEYFPGEEVRAALLVDTRKELQIRAATTELLCVGSYARGRQFLHLRMTEVLIRDRHMAPGREQLSVAFALPEDAPPTYHSASMSISWYIQSEIDLVGAYNPVERAELTVLCDESSLPEIEVESTQIGSDCRLNFDLQHDWVVEGEKVRGRLLVTPVRDIDVRQIRVELNRVEEILPTFGGSVHVREDARMIVAPTQLMRAGLEQTFEFELSVTLRDQPFVQTPVARAYAELRGVVVLRDHECFISCPILVTNSAVL